MREPGELPDGAGSGARVPQPCEHACEPGSHRLITSGDEVTGQMRSSAGELLGAAPQDLSEFRKGEQWEVESGNWR